MTGAYLEMQIRGWIVGPIIAFRQYIFEHVIPAFGNLNTRADEVEKRYFNNIGAESERVYGPDIDMASVAEGAESRSLGWYQMMTSLRQSMLNLLAAGLFHLTEQQIAVLCRDGGFMMAPPKDTQLQKVVKWYAENLHLDLETLPSWKLINELRLVANAVKHAEGSATKQLRTLRPELFSNAAFEEIYEEFHEHGGGQTIGPVHAPLSGEEFFVSETLMRTYAEGSESFFGEIADHFKTHSDDHY